MDFESFPAVAIADLCECAGNRGEKVSSSINYVICVCVDPFNSFLAFMFVKWLRLGADAQNSEYIMK